MRKYRSALELEIARALGDEGSSRCEDDENEDNFDDEVDDGDGEIRKLDGSCGQGVRIFTPVEHDTDEFLTENGWYTIKVTAADNEGFTLTADAEGDQVNDSDCTSFGLESGGKKTASSDNCWKK